MLSTSPSGRQNGTSHSEKTPIATEVNFTNPVVGELITENNTVPVSKDSNKGYLTFGIILQHLFSFFTGGARAIFFSYTSSKNPNQDEGELIRKSSSGGSSGIVTETTAKVVDVTSNPPVVEAVVISNESKKATTREEAIADIRTACKKSLTREEPAKNWDNLSDEGKVQARRDGYDRTIDLCKTILEHHTSLSDRTKEAAQGLLEAANTLKENVPNVLLTGKNMTEVVSKKLWESIFGSRGKSNVVPNNDQPDIEKELGDDNYSRLRTYIRDAESKGYNRGPFISEEGESFWRDRISGPEFDPLFKEEYNGIRSGYNIPFRSKDIESQASIIRFNEYRRILKQGLKRDLGVDMDKKELGVDMGNS
ncbi:MAG: hypothetical protein ACOYK6_01510 [Chthoniobacterales bacterium]